MHFITPQFCPRWAVWHGRSAVETPGWWTVWSWGLRWAVVGVRSPQKHRFAGWWPSRFHRLGQSQGRICGQGLKRSSHCQADLPSFLDHGPCHVHPGASLCQEDQADPKRWGREINKRIKAECYNLPHFAWEKTMAVDLKCTNSSISLLQQHFSTWKITKSDGHIYKCLHDNKAKKHDKQYIYTSFFWLILRLLCNVAWQIKEENYI